MSPSQSPIVVIDPGHGGSARMGGSSPNNAVGPNGLLEKDVTLDIGRRVATQLAGRADVILTRTTDDNRALTDRARISREATADVFLSIHLNGWRDVTVDGSEAWVARNASAPSRALARSVLDRVVAVTQARDRGVREADLGVLVSTRHAPNTAATLVEVAFLTNAGEAERLTHDDYRQALAQAIADGIAASALPKVTAQALASGPDRIDGIHPSAWNPNIPAPADLHADGIEFAIHRSTQGTQYVDPYYADRYRAARAAHFVVGAFHYGTTHEPKVAPPAAADAADYFRAQADHLVSVVGRLLPGDLAPTFDLEEKGCTGDVTWTGAQWLAPLEAFLDRVETALGRVPMIYTSRRIWRDFLHDDATLARIGEYPLWVVRLYGPKGDPNRYTTRMTQQPDLPSAWTDWAIWQYAGSESGEQSTPAAFTNLAAASTTMDMDVSNGGIHVLRGLADLGRPAPHGEAVRSVAYAEPDGTVMDLEFVGHWLLANVTQLAGAPLAAGDVAACEAGGRQYYAFRGRDDGHLYEISRDGAQTVVSDLTAAVVNAGTGNDPVNLRPASDPVYLVLGAERALVYRGESDHQYLLRTAGGTWQLPALDVTAGMSLADASGDAALYPWADGVHMVARAGRDGDLYDVMYDGSAATLNHLNIDDGPRATYRPSVYLENGDPKIVYRALRGHIHRVDTQGHDDDLSQLAGAPTCFGSPAAFVLNGVPHVVYRGVDGHVHDLAGDGAGGWTHQQIPCDVRAAADPAASVGSDGAFVVFRGRDESFHEAALGASGWTCTRIEPADNPPPASDLGVHALDAPPAPVITDADSSVADHVVAANPCGVRVSGGSYAERTPDGIVIHVLQAHYADVIASWSAGKSCLPPHYVIRNDGDITQVVAEKYMAQHAGPYGNPTLIGIEHDGWDGDPAAFTDEMYLWSSKLVREICDRRGIPIDRAHIIGHDEVRGTDHGDPGGYWDWDYYMALVRWDNDPATKPLRAVVDTSGMSLPASGAWHEEDRDSGNASWGVERMKMGPFPRNAYGTRYLWADGAADADPGDAVEFQFTVPEAGTWAVSGWWPVLPSANTATHIEFTTTSNDPTWQSASSVLDQSALWLRSRPTLALPHSPTWCPLPAFELRQNDVITARVLRRTDGHGRVFADAFRFLRT